MNLVGYSYDADYHCVTCTLNYAREVPYSEYVFGGYSDEDIADSPGIIDLTKAIELGIIRDSENDELHAIFNTDEAGDYPEHCGDCGVYIDTSWNGNTMNYAYERLQEWIDTGYGNEEVLDEWAANLHWCVGETEEQSDILATYELLRKKEREATNGQETIC
jgi:hypothetical protein